MSVQAVDDAAFQSAPLSPLGGGIAMESGVKMKAPRVTVNGTPSPSRETPEISPFDVTNDRVDECFDGAAVGLGLGGGQVQRPRQGRV